MEQSAARPRRPPPPATASPSPASANCRFLELHHLAFTEINNALSFDEQEKREEALCCYEKGIRLMEEALSLNITAQQSSDVTSKHEKMTATLSHSKCRVRELTRAQSTSARPSLPSFRQTGLPTYEEAISPAEGATGSDATPINADIVLEIANAQVYFITSEGYVSSPSYPRPLRICKFITQSIPGAPEHFLQIGTFTLPLVEDLTPSLQTSQGTYVFPDITSTQEGAAVGILLCENTSIEEVEAFEALITSLTALRSSSECSVETPASLVTNESQDVRQPPARPSLPAQAQSQDPSPSPTRLSTRIGHGLTVAADWVNWGLGKGAEKVGGLMTIGGAKLRENMKPGVVERSVDDNYRRGFATARIATDKVLVVSSFVVKALGEATVTLGKKAAPYIKSQATKMLPEKVTKPLSSKDASGRSKVDDVIEVAGAGLRGIGIVYIGLEEAAKALGRSLATQTTATMSHRYGEQYAQATDHVMYTVGNTLLSAHNINQLGPKAIAKRAAKDTAKAVIKPGSPGATASPPLTNGAVSSPPLVDIQTLEITEITSEDDLTKNTKT